MTLPTPCPGYDVAGLIGHIVEAGHRVVNLDRGQVPPAGDQARHIELTDAPHQLRHDAVDAANTWKDESRLTRSLTMPWAEEYTGAALVNMHLAELATHAWDLAMATGQVDRLDTALAGPALAGARTVTTAEYRNMVAPGSPFGTEIPPPPSASAGERLATFAGRDPRARLDR